MNPSTFSRLLEISHLSDTEQQRVLPRTRAPEVRAYLDALDCMRRLHVPAASAARKWDGRAQLLEAVATYHSTAASPAFSMRWLSELRGATAALAVSALLVASVAAASTVSGVSDSGGRFSQVLSALGLQSGEKTKPIVSPASSRDIPLISPEMDMALPSPALDDPAAAGLDGSTGVETPASDTDQPAALPPGQALDPPGQGGQNPGQGAGLPGQDGENPGQGAGPPGQDGENPGQGAEPPGQGDENPGQGAEPPGQAGENPGQGATPSIQSGENPGQGAEPPGQSGESPGQGSNPPGGGNGKKP